MTAPRRTRTIIGGIRDQQSARWAVDAGADAISFVFVKKSARFIEPTDALEIMQSLPPCVSTIAVLHNPTIELFMDIEEACPATHTLLSGSESDQLVAQCAPVFKAIKYNEPTCAGDLAHWAARDGIDAIVIDNVWNVGDTPFDWNTLAAHTNDATKPIVLSGDLTAASVGSAITRVQPYAVEVSAGVESSRGVKDQLLIEAFCSAVRAADSGA